jgi:hypothetical protein
VVPDTPECPALEVDDALPPGVDLSLEEFVIDDDDYPEISADRRRAAPTTEFEPDRVDDIDQWLEEFAVEDCCCDSLPG